MCLECAGDARGHEGPLFEELKPPSPSPALQPQEGSCIVQVPAYTLDHPLPTHSCVMAKTEADRGGRWSSCAGCAGGSGWAGGGSGARCSANSSTCLAAHHALQHITPPATPPRACNLHLSINFFSLNYRRVCLHRTSRCCRPAVARRRPQACRRRGAPKTGQ